MRVRHDTSDRKELDQRHKDAEKWIFNRTNKDPGSLLWCCCHLGISAVYIRSLARKAKSKRYAELKRINHPIAELVDYKRQHWKQKTPRAKAISPHSRGNPQTKQRTRL